MSRWLATSLIRPRPSGRRSSTCSTATASQGRCASSISAVALARSPGGWPSAIRRRPCSVSTSSSRTSSSLAGMEARSVGASATSRMTPSLWGRGMPASTSWCPARVTGRARLPPGVGRDHPRAQARRVAAPAVGGLRHGAHARTRRRCLRSGPVLEHARCSRSPRARAVTRASAATHRPCWSGSATSTSPWTTSSSTRCASRARPLLPSSRPGETVMRSPSQVPVGGRSPLSSPTSIR